MQDRLSALLCGMAREFQNRRDFFVLRFLSDESERDDLFVVAGYGALCHNWVPLTEAWNATLREDRPLEYYKTNDLLSPCWRKDNGWSEPDALAKIDQMARVIYMRKELLRFSVYATVTKSEFTSVIDEFRRRLKKLLHEPDHFCFFAIVAESLKQMVRDNLLGQTVDFVFDDKGAISDSAAAIIRFMRGSLKNASMRECLGYARPDDDKKIAALQMADMYAARVRDFRNGIASTPLFEVQPLSVIPIRIDAGLLHGYLRDIFDADGLR